MKSACGCFLTLEYRQNMRYLYGVIMKNTQNKYTWLTSLLKGWGIKESWAKVLAGAILGALCAAGVIALDACCINYKQNAAGDRELTATVVHPAPVHPDK